MRDKVTSGEQLAKRSPLNSIWLTTASIGLLATPAALYFTLLGVQSLPPPFERGGGAWVGGLYVGYPSLVGVWLAAQTGGLRSVFGWLWAGSAIVGLSCGWTLYFYICTHDFLAGFEDQLPHIILGTLRRELSEAAVAGCMFYPIAVVQGRSLRRRDSITSQTRWTIWAIMGWTGCLAAILAVQGLPTNGYYAMVTLAERTQLFFNVAGFALFLTCISEHSRWTLAAPVAAHVLGRALWLVIMPTAFHWQHDLVSDSELSDMPLLPPKFWELSVGQAAAFLTLLLILYGCCKLSGMWYLKRNMVP